LVSKLLKSIETMLPSILKRKGCDASNIFDEEANRNEKDFSDDEAEREFKKGKKLKKRIVREDGEIESDKDTK
jgi:DNA-directed RNA polymerase subunit E'/Rpb7